MPVLSCIPQRTVGSKTNIPALQANSTSAELESPKASVVAATICSPEKALDQANKTSFGYFIYQDSSFGNNLLPVIPRISPPEIIELE